MTLRHLKIFVAVCDYEGITIAAEKLGFTQPAVSLAIKELETYYGVKLFDRIAKKLYITETGKRFLGYAKKITALVEEMKTEIKDWDAVGKIRVGSSITIGTCLLPAMIREFAAGFPQADIAVTIDNSEVIVKKILSNTLDFALIEGIAHSEQLISESLMTDTLVLVCGCHHPLAEVAAITLEELTRQTLILREKGSGTRELFDSTLLTQGLSAEPSWESISTEAIISAVADGLGVSVLPLKLVRRELDARRLITVTIRGIHFNRNFNIIYHKDKHLSGPARSFIRICKGFKALP